MSKHVRQIMDAATVRQTNIVLEKDESKDTGDLLTFQNVIGRQTCLPEHFQKAIHFSDLPIEIVLYILRLIPGNSHEKLKILDRCAAVCRGWYICARDPSIYREECSKIWTKNIMEVKEYGGSWRRMLLERPVIYTAGCYVTEQDFLLYFHYLRFYYDGCFVYFQSKQHPKEIIPKLKRMRGLSKYKNVRTGQYEMFDDNIIMRFNLRVSHYLLSQSDLSLEDYVRVNNILILKCIRNGNRMLFRSNEDINYHNGPDIFLHFLRPFYYSSFI